MSALANLLPTTIAAPRTLLRVLRPVKPKRLNRVPFILVLALVLGIGMAGAIVTPLSGMLLAWLIGLVLPLGTREMDILFLSAALPPAVTNYIFADRYQQETDKVAAIVMIGNVSALLFIPLALALRL